MDTLQKKDKTVNTDMSMIVLPAVTPDQAKIVWKQYEDMKMAILDPVNDIQKIEGKDFKKKSYWRKLQVFFNLSVDIVDEKREEFSNTIMWNFTVKATAPNGRSAIGIGSCDTWEKGRKNTLHNTRATAMTRATNRAISDLVGGGEVSAEEVEMDNIVEKQTSPKQMQNKPQQLQNNKQVVIMAEELQIKCIHGVAQRNKFTEVQLFAWVKKNCNREVQSLNELTKVEAQKMITDMNASLKNKTQAAAPTAKKLTPEEEEEKRVKEKHDKEYEAYLAEQEAKKAQPAVTNQPTKK